MFPRKQCVASLCSETNHKQSIKTTHIYYLKVSLVQEFRYNFTGSSAQGLQVCSQGVEQADFLPGGWKNLEESAFKLSQVVHKIYFLV